MITRLHFDMEFTGLHQKTTLISLGITSPVGATFYAELNDYSNAQVDQWLTDNVIANLKYKAPIMGKDDFILEEDHPKVTDDNPKVYSVSMRCNSNRLKVELTKWLDQFSNTTVQMVSDCLAYDWVLFNQIFGHAFKIPKYINYIPYDICTAMMDLGIDPDISREEFISDMSGEHIKGVKHNSLYDAKVIKACDEKLSALRMLGANV